MERRNALRPRTARSGKWDRTGQRPGRARPLPSPTQSPHPPRPTQKDTSTKASAASSSYGPWRRRPRPIQKRDSRTLPSCAATPTTASPQKRPKQTQNGRHDPSSRRRLRAPSLHRGGESCPRDGLPAVPAAPGAVPWCLAVVPGRHFVPAATAGGVSGLSCLRHPVVFVVFGYNVKQKLFFAYEIRLGKKPVSLKQSLYTVVWGWLPVSA